MAAQQPPLLPSESAAVLALGSRTTMLHPELLRHRAWWREILDKEVHKRRAERVTLASAPEKDPGSLLVDGERHPHVDLLEDVGAFFSGDDGLGGRSVRGALIGELADMAAKVAGSDLESKELASIVCGYSGASGTTLLVWKSNPGGKNLIQELSQDGFKSLGLVASRLHRNDLPRLPHQVAYEIRRALNRGPGGSILAGGSVDSGGSNSSGRVIVLQIKGVERKIRQLGEKVKLAKVWHDRHPACFLPVSWAFCAAFDAKYLDGPREPTDGKGCVAGGDRRGKAGFANIDTIERPSNFALLALLAAFLDKDSTARGVSKESFGVGPNPSFAKQNPNLAELFLRFCSFVRQLGVANRKGGMALKLVLDNGELQEQWVAAIQANKGRQHQQSGGKGGARARGKGGVRRGRGGRGRGGGGRGQGEGQEGEREGERRLQILLRIGVIRFSDLMNESTVSELKCVCAAIEQSLTPDGVYGLPVWKQDIRWSLLGFAFERNSGEEKEKEEGEMEETFTGRAGLPSYLDWMEVQLLMCMNDDIDAMPGMYGFNVTGRAPRTPAMIAELNEQQAADVRQARTADIVFTAAMRVDGDGRGVGRSDGGGGSGGGINGDSSDSLFAESGSDDGEEDEEELDGVPMSMETSPPHQALSVDSPAGVVEVAAPAAGGSAPISAERVARATTQRGKSRQGVDGPPLVLPLSAPNSVPQQPSTAESTPPSKAVAPSPAPAKTPATAPLKEESSRPSALGGANGSKAGKAGTILAFGDRLMKEAADLIASARATAPPKEPVSSAGEPKVTAGVAADGAAAATASTNPGALARREVGGADAAASAGASGTKTESSMTLLGEGEENRAGTNEGTKGGSGHDHETSRPPGSGGGSGRVTSKDEEAEDKGDRERAKAAAKERGLERGKQIAEKLALKKKLQDEARGEWLRKRQAEEDKREKEQRKKEKRTELRRDEHLRHAMRRRMTAIHAAKNLLAAESRPRNRIRRSRSSSLTRRRRSRRASLDSRSSSSSSRSRSRSSSSSSRSGTGSDNSGRYPSRSRRGTRNSRSRSDSRSSHRSSRDSLASSSSGSSSEDNASATRAASSSAISPATAPAASLPASSAADITAASRATVSAAPPAAGAAGAAVGAAAAATATAVSATPPAAAAASTTAPAAALAAIPAAAPSAVSAVGAGAGTEKDRNTGGQGDGEDPAGPAGWSEWRAMSSSDDNGGDGSDSGARKSEPTRCVRGIEGGGFRIQVRRGSSLQRRSSVATRRSSQLQRSPGAPSTQQDASEVREGGGGGDCPRQEADGQPKRSSSGRRPGSRGITSRSRSRSRSPSAGFRRRRKSPGGRSRSRSPTLAVGGDRSLRVAGKRFVRSSSRERRKRSRSRSASLWSQERRTRGAGRRSVRSLSRERAKRPRSLSSASRSEERRTRSRPNSRGERYGGSGGGWDWRQARRSRSRSRSRNNSRERRWNSLEPRFGSSSGLSYASQASKRARVTGVGTTRAAAARTAAMLVSTPSTLKKVESVVTAKEKPAQAARTSSLSGTDASLKSKPTGSKTTGATTKTMKMLMSTPPSSTKGGTAGTAKKKPAQAAATALPSTTDTSLEGKPKNSKTTTGTTTKVLASTPPSSNMGGNAGTAKKKPVQAAVKALASTTDTSLKGKPKDSKTTTGATTEVLASTPPGSNKGGNAGTAKKMLGRAAATAPLIRTDISLKGMPKKSNTAGATTTRGKGANVAAKGTVAAKGNGKGKRRVTIPTVAVSSSSKNADAARSGATGDGSPSAEGVVGVVAAPAATVADSLRDPKIPKGPADRGGGDEQEKGEINTLIASHGLNSARAVSQGVRVAGTGTTQAATARKTEIQVPARARSNAAKTPGTAKEKPMQASAKVPPSKIPPRKNLPSRTGGGRPSSPKTAAVVAAARGKGSSVTRNGKSQGEHRGTSRTVPAASKNTNPVHGGAPDAHGSPRATGTVALVGAAADSSLDSESPCGSGHGGGAKGLEEGEIEAFPVKQLVNQKAQVRMPSKRAGRAGAKSRAPPAGTASCSAAVTKATLGRVPGAPPQSSQNIARNQKTKARKRAKAARIRAASVAAARVPAVTSGNTSAPRATPGAPPTPTTPAALAAPTTAAPATPAAPTTPAAPPGPAPAPSGNDNA